MGRSTIITCDNCDADLNTKGERTRSRLHLQDERIPAKELLEHRPEPPLLNADAYFCSLECLQRWEVEGEEH